MISLSFVENTQIKCVKICKLCNVNFYQIKRIWRQNFIGRGQDLCGLMSPWRVTYPVDLQLSEVRQQIADTVNLLDGRRQLQLLRQTA